MTVDQILHVFSFDTWEDFEAIMRGGLIWHDKSFFCISFPLLLDFNVFPLSETELNSLEDVEPQFSFNMKLSEITTTEDIHPLSFEITETQGIQFFSNPL